MAGLFRALGYAPLRNSQLADLTLAGGVKTGQARGSVAPGSVANGLRFAREPVIGATLGGV